MTARIDALLSRQQELLAEVSGLARALDEATGPHCSSCGNAIDPDCCWCGDGPANHHLDEAHSFIPMGCDCCRDPVNRDWKRRASALRERLFASDKQAAKLEVRQQELLALIERLSREAPYSDEIKGWENQRRALIAEIGILRARVTALERPAPSAADRLTRDDRQARLFAWSKVAFSIEQATSLPQRGIRLLEEAIEAFQAVGGDPAQAHKLVDFVFSRPIGELHQEIGGVSMCLLALAAAAGLSAAAEEQREFARVMECPVEEFRQRNAAKNAAGFLAIPPAGVAPP